MAIRLRWRSSNSSTGTPKPRARIQARVRSTRTPPRPPEPRASAPRAHPLTEDRAAPRVLAISSQVVYGPVGSSAAVPAMRRLGLDVLELPSVLLSNHPGHGAPVRQVIGA